MKIAVNYDEGNIFQHFGKTEKFKVYETEDGKVINAFMLEATEGGHSALATLLSDNKIDAVICGGIGGGAINTLGQLGIKIYGGAQGSCDEAVDNFLKGKLVYDPEVKCAHHDEHHGEDHTCHGPDECQHKCG